MDLVDKLIGYLQDGNAVATIIVAMAILIFKYKEVSRFLQGIRRSRIARLEEALKCNLLTGTTRSHVEEELATEQFKAATGIGLEKEFREAVIAAHRRTNGDLAFIHFKRALPHLKFKGMKLTVRLSWIDRQFHRLFFYGGAFLILMNLILMNLLMEFGRLGSVEYYSTLIMSFCLVLGGLYMLYLSLPMLSAEVVRRHFNLDNGGAIPFDPGVPKS